MDTKIPHIDDAEDDVDDVGDAEDANYALTQHLFLPSQTTTAGATLTVTDQGLKLRSIPNTCHVRTSYGPM